MAIVEGRTESIFVKDILAPYLWGKNIEIIATILTKPGQKGGDVKFSKAKNDIGKHLKQRKDNYITLLIDFYGTTDKEWPGLAQAKAQNNPEAKANIFNQKMLKKIEELFGDHTKGKRFIPYVSMHEFEALLFSNAGILAKKLNVNQSKIDSILEECDEPENINDSKETAPSKRIERLYSSFGKTATGITIAREIGIQTIREKCPLFNAWLDKLEALAQN
jgi:hypothetical protein